MKSGLQALAVKEKNTHDVLCPSCRKITTIVTKRHEKHIYRRAFSESKLADALDHNLENGFSYHCISGGDIDSMSFAKHIVRQQKLDYLLLSTWCMALDDVEQVAEWLGNGKVKRVDAYCGEIFPGSYKKEFEELKKVVRPAGGRVCIFRNHSKIFAGIGDKFSFAIESSANINTNPRSENTTIIVDDEIFHFYKDFFDGIKSFNRDFDEWKKLKI